MKNMRKQTIILIFITLLVCISIGYALVYTNLKTIGTATINKQTWDVHFDNVQVTEGSKTPISPATITNGTPTQVSYNVYLENPGDFYEFTVDAVNNGTVDAMITDIEYLLNNVEMSPTNKLPDYVKYIVTYADGVEVAENHLLAKATVSGNTIIPTKQKYKIRVEFRSNITADDLIGISEVTANLKLKVTYGQATDDAIPKPVWRILNGKTVDNLSIGDELCLNDQCFNFIRYDGTNDEDVVMLAKWNLKVGDIYNNSNKIGEYTSNDTGYGLQSSEAKGFISGSSSLYNGVVPFSATNYWNGSVSSYPADVYDATNYITAPDFSTTCNNTNNCWKTPGYSVAYYVEQYKTKLVNDYHATIKSARLLTYSEATDSSVGCPQTSIASICPTTGDSAFITQTSYWLGTCYINSMYVLYSDRYFCTNSYDTMQLGVRPVIVVTKSNIRAS